MSAGWCMCGTETCYMWRGLIEDWRGGNDVNGVGNSNGLNDRLGLILDLGLNISWLDYIEDAMIQLYCFY